MNLKDELIKKYRINVKIVLFILFSLFILSYLFILYNSRDNIFKKGRKYLDICLKGQLLNKHIKNFINNKVSVIIPIYNYQQSIKSVIRSIQNQKMLEIEIILVNDNSKDNTLEILYKMQEEDKRIKIINNKKNMGTLYSRSIGVLKSKGNYIFPLDNDDMFFDNDVFEVVYNEAILHDFDIVGFRFVQAYNYNANILEMTGGCHMHNTSFIVYQPELSLFGISNNNKLKITEVHIWSKCIKNTVYKKAINALGIKRYSIFMSWCEDTSMIFILFNIAKSYRYLLKYGIFRYNRQLSASNHIAQSIKLFGEIFRLDIVFDFTKNNFKYKKYAFYFALKLKNMVNFKSINESNRNYLILVIQKLLNCQYINYIDKKILKRAYKNIIK